MKTVNPELARLSQKDGSNLSINEASVPKCADKRVVQISHEREVPLPVALADRSHEMALNAFRNFGINE